MTNVYPIIVQKCPSAVTETFLGSLEEIAKGKATNDSVQIPNTDRLLLLLFVMAPEASHTSLSYRQVAPGIHKDLGISKESPKNL